MVSTPNPYLDDPDPDVREFGTEVVAHLGDEHLHPNLDGSGTDIAAVQAQIDALQAGLDAAQAQLDGHQSDAVAHGGEVTQAELDALQSQVSGHAANTSIHGGGSGGGGGPWLNVADLGAVGDNTFDNADVFDLAYDTIRAHQAGPGGYDAGKGTIYIPPGTYNTSRALRLHQGITWQGDAPYTTTVARSLIAPGNVFEVDPTFEPGEFLHWGGIKGMSIRHNGGQEPGDPATFTVGNGIDFGQARVGEGFQLNQLIVLSSPENGIIVRRGAQPTYWYDLHFFGCGVHSGEGYGLKLSRTGQDIIHGFNVWGISGDNNKNALIRVENMSDRQREGAAFHGIKSEEGTAGRMVDECVVSVDNCRAPIHLSDVHHTAINFTVLEAMVRVFSGDSSIVITGGCTGNFYNWVKDDRSGQVADKNSIEEILYHLTWRGTLGIASSSERIARFGNGVDFEGYSGDWMYLQLPIATDRNDTVTTVGAQVGRIPIHDTDRNLIGYLPLHGA